MANETIAIYAPIHKNAVMDKRRKICLTIALISTLAFAYMSFSLASAVQGTSGYVTDEIWYVSSSRNILREIYEVQPSYIDSDGGHHYTVFFSSHYELSKAQANFRNFVETNLGGEITHEYDKVAAFSIVTYRKLDYDTILDSYAGIKIIQSGFNYPDASNIGNYMNTEHPPLAKYTIGLSMLVAGDQPINWRIPGVIFGSLTLLFVYLTAVKLINNEIIPLFVYLFAFTDPVFRAMTAAAMLDIYAAFFIALSVWLALRRNYFLSALAIGLASACKFTGAFSVFALFVFMVYGRKTSVKKLIVYPFIVPIIIWLSSNAPLIIKLGPHRWFNELLSGLSWFATSRPPGPPVSSPWGWFVNQAPFMLNANPNVFASVNPVVYAMALAALVLIPFLAHKIRRESLGPALWFICTFVGYVALYLVGNTTQYSYYIVTLSPMAYVLACMLFYYIWEKSQQYKGLMLPWKKRRPIKRKRNASKPKITKKTILGLD